VYIDIASCSSPVPEIYHKLYGSTTYRQDIRYPEGINGNVIGGDAAKMPIEDGFATKMALHCSFEHFENDADINFIKEADRTLKNGGRLCILPLYVSTEYAIVADPAVLTRRNMPAFENDATIYCKRGVGIKHGRFYDIPHFVSRIINNKGGLALTIYDIENAAKLEQSCYLKFAAVFDKRG
jgi:SAM-dependent methyltransferase